jgi:cytochrome c oxidase cbb3-type subunit 3
MNKTNLLTCFICIVAFYTPVLLASSDEIEHRPPPRKLTSEQEKVAAANYQKYCTLCHGEDRQGYVNDLAPSLKSKSLFESGIPHAVLRPIQYGRHGTAMAGYLDEVGGPMTLDETWDLTYWLFWQSGADRVKLGNGPVEGDIESGKVTYMKNCSVCHGKEGEGVSAPALGNPSALAHNTDEFIRYAIKYGRNDTPMISWKDKLSTEDIDNLTAFIRSRASGWTDDKPVLSKLPTREEYVINPEGADPDFKLSDDLYVSSDDLAVAVKAKNKMIIFDTRASSVWQVAHIEGSFPLPYYSDFSKYEEEFPKDVQIVAYCSCPRAAADYVVGKLRDLGYSKSAVLYEGIFGWQYLGYPVVRRDIKAE